MIQKPVPTKQFSPTMNLFEPSPIQKLLYITAAAIVQSQQSQHPDSAVKSLKKMQTPMKDITPTQFLRIGSNHESISTPNLLRSESSFFQQHFMAGPKGFNLDVIYPTKSMLQSSPLNEQSNGGISPNGFSSDGEKDADSTDYSQEKRDDDQFMSQSGSLSTEMTKKKKPLEINGIIIDNYLASDNLNECVDYLLRKDKGENRKNVNKIIRHNSSAKSKEKKKRQRKNLD